jgi:predicted nucleotidyltransferase
MAKIPHSPEVIFDEFVNDLRAVYQNDLESVVLYGSGAKGEYIRKKSDINFLVVLSENGIGHLHKSFNLVKKWTRRKVAVPLFMTKSYIESSLDSFPIEFLSMQQNYKVVFGDDVLANLEIPQNELRLECEEQVKGKLLHLREGFLASAGKKRPLEELLSISVPSFISLFQALLLLKEETRPIQKGEIFSKTGEVYGFDQNVFDDILQVRNRTKKFSTEDLIELTQKYITEIRKLAIIIDQW